MSTLPGAASKQPRISRPSSVRTGTFCRLGFVDASRPVVAAACTNVVCMRDSAVGQLRQDVEVGLEELVELAPALDLGDDLVLVADRLQHAGVGREAGLAAALARQAELLEEHRAELLRRADDELLAGQRPDLALEVVRSPRARACPISARRSRFRRTPATSMSRSTLTSGSSTSAMSDSRPRSASCSRCQAASACRTTASAPAGSSTSEARPRSSQISRNGKPRRAGSSR